MEIFMKTIGAFAFVVVGLYIFYLLLTIEPKRFAISASDPIGNLASTEVYLSERGLSREVSTMKTAKKKMILKEEKIITYKDASREETINLVLDEKGEISKIEAFFMVIEGHEGAIGIILVKDICEKYWKELTGQDLKFRDISRPGGSYTAEALFSNARVDASFLQAEQGNRNYFHTMKIQKK
jgi:hypothetical protein